MGPRVVEAELAFCVVYSSEVRVGDRGKGGEGQRGYVVFKVHTKKKQTKKKANNNTKILGMEYFYRKGRYIKVLIFNCGWTRMLS